MKKIEGHKTGNGDCFSNLGKRHRGAEMSRKSLDVKTEKGTSLVNAKSCKNVNCGCAHFRVQTYRINNSQTTEISIFPYNWTKQC